MRITYKPIKRVAPAHPQVASLISTIFETPNDKLADVFESIHTWRYPRSDLHSWIGVLNRLDEVYEAIIQEYDLSKLQNKQFTAISKRVLLGLLRFQRLLLDNSTNRKLYNSYDKLNALLSTSDLDVLTSVLQLILRPAQQYSAQPSVAQTLRISPTKFQALARQWPTYFEHGISLADLASQGPTEIAKIESLPLECSDLTFTFYRRETTSMDAVQATGPTTVHIPLLSESSQDPFETLVTVVETHQVPPEDQFELLSRIRSHWAMGKDRTEERIKLVVIRLLALAIFAHTHQESEAQASLLMYEPDIIGHISELLQLGRDIPPGVRSAALAALDSLARYRGRTQDVLSGINAGLNHGILMSLLRRTVADMIDPQSDLMQSFTETLLTFISFLATHTAGGNMLIGAGIIPLLIQIVKNELPARLVVVSKTMTLIDNILYGYPNAFQIFVTSGGVDVMVNRVKHEVELDLQECRKADGNATLNTLSVQRSALLKHLLRSIHRLMHSSGTTEGLRGLIDSSLVKSITQIIEHRSLFGPSVSPLAINIMTTFIHNEPTSLHVLQEARLPEIFYSAIESGLEPVMEVIQSVPNALGALCLNQTGVDQLVDRPEVLGRFFEIFTTEKHVKLLQEKDNAIIIGSAIDELIRHHPALGDRIFTAITQTLERIEFMGSHFEEEPSQRHMYRLVIGSVEPPAATNTLGLDQDSLWNQNHERTPMEVEESGEGGSEDRKVENLITTSFDVFNRFLEGLFQHVHHCREFIEKYDGLDRLGRILGLASLPFKYGSSIASDALVQVMRSLIEASPTTTLTTLAKQVQDSVKESEECWKHKSDTSRLFELLESQDTSNLELANKHFRCLVTLHIRVTLLSDVCQVTGYPQGRAVNAVLQALTASEIQTLIPVLGAVHRHSIWEHLNLTRQLNAKGLGHFSPAASDQSTALQTASPVGDTSPDQIHPQVIANQSHGDASLEPLLNTTTANAENGVKKNAKALMYIASELPKTLKGFFMAIVKMFLFSRRNPDSAQREQATQAADMIAGLLLEHLTFIGEGIEPASMFAYEAVVVRLIAALLSDDRSSDWGLHIGLLLGLVRKEALQATIHVLIECTTSISRLSLIPAALRTDVEATELLRAITCSKVAVKLLATLASAKAILESNQTPFNATPGKGPSDTDYFEPHDLISRIRLVVLPSLAELWHAPWLGTVAGILTRDVVQAIMEILDAEGEQVAASSEPRIQSNATDARTNRAAEPDENRIQQLCDMGFPRSAAMRALQRTNNNINAATEYLLSHPLPFPPDRAPTVPENIIETHTNPSSQLEAESMEAESTVLPAREYVVADSSSVPPVEVGGAPNSPTLQAVSQSLECMRNPLREDFGKVALSLLDHNPDLIFVVRPAFIDEGWKSKNLQAILDDIRAFAPSAHDISEFPLVQRFRLLALVLNASPSLSLKEHELRGLLAHCLALLLANPVDSGTRSATTPRWLAPLLLVVHALFVKGEEPLDDALTLGEDALKEGHFVGPSYAESRPLIFDFCFRVLALPSPTSDELLAAFRLLVHLTRDAGMAKEFYNRDGIKLLMDVLRQHPERNANLRLQFILLLRHVAEDTRTLETIMRYEITRRFAPRSRTLDVNALLRHSSPVVLREPSLFIRVASSLCELVPTNPGFQHVVLKKEIVSPPSNEDEQPSQSAMQVDEGHSLEHAGLEGLIHSLLAFLLESGKPAVEYTLTHNSSTAKNDVTGTNMGQEIKSKDTNNNLQEGYINYVTACFLMQSLTELLFSYTQCKHAFLSFSKKRGAGVDSKDSKAHRMGVLNFLLSEIVCYSSLTRPESADSRKRALLSQWGMSVILALCVDPWPNRVHSRDVPADLTSIRKFVLDAMTKAVKETSTLSSTEIRYGKLASLADLIYRLLVVKSTFGPSKERDDTPLQLAKLMLEKNFVSTLTGALADVDTNYPGARSLVSNILRPLEQLTKVAIKMARPSGHQSEESQEGPDGAESGQSGSDEERPSAADDRQETPDLYRNSALGIYGGEMEDINFEGDEDEMLDAGEEVEEDEMDLDYDEVETDSENTSEDIDDVGPEEDHRREVMEPEGWHESDEEEGPADEPEVHMLNADEINEDDIDPEGDDVWPDMHIEEGLEEEDVAGEDGEGLGGMPIGEDADDEEGGDDQSEDLDGNLELIEDGEEQALTHDHNFARDLEQWFDVGGASVNDRDVFIRSSRRRGPGDTLQHSLFGNTRAGHAQQTSTAHPLLVEPSTASNTRDHTGPSHRLLHEGQHGHVVASIEELVGPGALQFFQQLLTRTGARGEIVGLEVPSAGIVATVDRSGNIHRHPQPYPPANERSREPSDDVEEFSPAPTHSRWSDEIKITQGGNEATRAAKLSQHLVLLLLPAAKRALKELETVEQQRKEEEEKIAKAREVDSAAPTEQDNETLGEPTIEPANSQSNSDVSPEDGSRIQHQSESQDYSPEAAAQLVDTAAQAMQGISVADDHTVSEIEQEDIPAAQTSGIGNSQPDPTPGPSRIHVQIHGNAVDITDTGIDPTFLEALPDDMREEVLNQHFREQRRAATGSQAAREHDSEINPEFLEALPPEIRAELLDQEAEQARRRANQPPPAAATTRSGPVEMDSATFLASLDPQLRQVVLMEQDETFLETLPPALLAEVTHYREVDQTHYIEARRPAGQTAMESSAQKKIPPPRDSIHLLDKVGVATLIRLLFHPQVLRKNTLQKVLINLCENSKTRIEVYHTILSVLVEVSHSTPAERPTQPIQRASKISYGKSPSKPRSGIPLDPSSTHTSVMKAVYESGLPAQLILQRCIEALYDIASASDVAPIYFLTEQEQPVLWKKGLSKKGKGKDRMHPSPTQCPLSLLLSLLDSQFFLKNTGMMDSLVALLATITRPLATEIPKTAQPVEKLVSEQPPSALSDQSPTHATGPSSQGEGSSSAPRVEEEGANQTQNSSPPLLERTPNIAPGTLRLVVNILTAGDCSGRTFQHCLTLIQHLSCIPGARDAIITELQARAHELGEQVHSDLQSLIQSFSRLGNTAGLPDEFATKFSLPSAEQAKFLRILKTIEYLFTEKATVPIPEATSEHVTAKGEGSDQLSNIYRSFQFSTVWQRLSEFLSLLHERLEGDDHATVLLPLIESLMVVCKHTTVQSVEGSVASPINDTSGKAGLFVAFTDTHRKILNAMVRNNPSLMSGSFSLLVKNPRVLDFDNKRNFFTQQLRRRPYSRDHYNTLQLNVRRARVFEDSYQYLQRKSGDQIKYGKLSIRFYNEEGVDAGGVTREWFTILARQMFNPDYALFQPCAADKLTYQPNRASSVNPEHLSFFKFVGRVIGKAIFDGRLLDAYFARSLFRQLLGKPVDYKDVEWVDPEYYKSLIWILENDPAPLDLSFIVEDSQFGVTTIVPLKENGENIAVTQENKREYVQLSAEYRLVKSIKEQIDALLGGFYEIIPKSLIAIFNEQEVELLIAGTPDVDVDEWRAATDYHGYSSSDPVITWWWRALKSFNREEKAKLLGFATGTTRVPLGGFTELQGVQGVQRFSIHKAYGDPNRLPQAHTCFNQIDLPEYASYEKLRASLLMAINEGSTGFGFA